MTNVLILDAEVAEAWAQREAQREEEAAAARRQEDSSQYAAECDAAWAAHRG